MYAHVHGHTPASCDVLSTYMHAYMPEYMQVPVPVASIRLIACTHALVHAHTHMCTYTCAHVGPGAWIRVRDNPWPATVRTVHSWVRIDTCLDLCVCRHVWVCRRSLVRVRVRLRLRVRVHVRTRVRVRACMCVCRHGCV